VLVINEESPRCLADKEEFLALKEGKKFERKKKIAAREYVAECLTEREEYMEYILFVEPVCLKSEGTAHG
jgi:mannitol/fructose-specific phosphotransferase system IIA component (Ntr-type)